MNFLSFLINEQDGSLNIEKMIMNAKTLVVCELYLKLNLFMVFDNLCCLNSNKIDFESADVWY